MAEESTTPDLMELSRRALDATNRRDFDAVASFYAPDAVYRGTEIGTFEGAGAIRGLLEDFLGSYEECQHVDRGLDRAPNGLHGHRRGPRCRRTPCRVEGVGDVA
jgi:ketosteroid isomerase-like protein